MNDYIAELMIAQSPQIKIYLTDGTYVTSINKLYLHAVSDFFAAKESFNSTSHTDSNIITLNFNMDSIKLLCDYLENNFKALKNIKINDVMDFFYLIDYLSIKKKPAKKILNTLCSRDYSYIYTLFTNLESDMNHFPIIDTMLIDNFYKVLNIAINKYSTDHDNILQLFGFYLNEIHLDKKKFVDTIINGFNNKSLSTNFFEKLYLTINKTFFDKKIIEYMESVYYIDLSFKNNILSDHIIDLRKDRGNNNIVLFDSIYMVKMQFVIKRHILAFILSKKFVKIDVRITCFEKDREISRETITFLPGHNEEYFCEGRDFDRIIIDNIVFILKDKTLKSLLESYSKLEIDAETLHEHIISEYDIDNPDNVSDSDSDSESKKSRDAGYNNILTNKCKKEIVNFFMSELLKKRS